MNSLWVCLSGRLNMASTLALKNKRNYVDIQEKAEGQESWIFTDTECLVDKKTSLQWNTLFQAFQ